MSEKELNEKRAEALADTLMKQLTDCVDACVKEAIKDGLAPRIAILTAVKSLMAVQWFAYLPFVGKGQEAFGGMRLAQLNQALLNKVVGRYVKEGDDAGKA